MREKSQEKKNGILQATLELVADQGFHGTSISQIANKAGVNVGSIYYYFESKDDILNALYLDCKTRITQRAFCHCTESDSAEKRLKFMIRNIIEYFSENQRELAFIVQYENSPYLANIISTEKYANILKPYIDLFNELRAENVIKELPIGVLHSLISGAVISLASYYIEHAEAFEEAALTSTIDAIWDMAKK
ncbi:MAG: TetR/AcrR family transcriptional regulator [Clostridiales Family XIII bacterium]|nr:TetR/AcrR family transcriptional regulator [Clostridiales Family XIII bacterium]